MKNEHKVYEQGWQKVSMAVDSGAVEIVTPHDTYRPPYTGDGCIPTRSQVRQREWPANTESQPTKIFIVHHGGNVDINDVSSHSGGETVGVSKADVLVRPPSSIVSRRMIH